MDKQIKNVVKYMNTSDIKELVGNPRTITKEDFDRLKTSIKDNPEYFEARPLIVSDRTGEMVVIAGNQRLRAAKALGIEQVPAVVLHNLTEEKEKEIVIRDNVSNGRWDMDLLANNYDIGDLADWGVAVNLKDDFEAASRTALTDDEVQQIIKSQGEITLDELNDNIVFTIKLPHEDYDIAIKALRQFDKNIGLTVVPEASEVFDENAE